MTYSQKKLPFTQLMVSIVPSKPGIYTFWNQKGQIIYIGSAEKPNNLYEAIKQHFNNNHSISIEGIYDFQIEVCNDSNRQKNQHLEDHKKCHGYLPDYNKTTSTSNKRGE